MPYLREFYENESKPFIATGYSSSSVESPMLVDQALLQGFRSHPHPRAKSSTEVADYIADPYAYFLDTVSEKRYQARLAERNIVAVGSPDRGHSFQLCKYTLGGSLLALTGKSQPFGSGLQTWDISNGVITLDPGYFDLPNGSPYPLVPRKLDSVGLDTFAQQAYLRTAPTSVVFDAAQFLGELREGLPRLVPDVLKSSSKIFKNIGSDYLNIEFGWKPFINDLINMGKALAGSTAAFSHVGIRTHRRFGTPPKRTSFDGRYANCETLMMVGLGSLDAPYGNPSLPTGYTRGPSHVNAYLLRTSEQTRWFEGEFTSFMPLGFDPSSYLDRLNRLINFKLTPETLWNLAPWTWLVDWQLRIGDTIAANQAAANDLLVMHYGYAMEQTVYRDLLSLDFSATPRIKPRFEDNYWPVTPASSDFIATTTYKRRVRANPFGFKTGGADALSGGQLQILGALGLTKLK